MMKMFLSLCILGGSLLSFGPQLVAQQIVHAITGTVSSISSTGKTITLFQDSGSRTTFAVVPSSPKRISFDDRIADEATAAKEFQKKGAYVVLFYFGIEENRTAVALKSMGPGPFSSTVGEVTGWNGHNHTLSVRDKEGEVHSFLVEPKTVAETYMGVVNGSKVDFEKGERVRLVSSANNAKPSVLFIRQK